MFAMHFVTVLLCFYAEYYSSGQITLFLIQSNQNVEFCIASKRKNQGVSWVFFLLNFV